MVSSLDLSRMVRLGRDAVDDRVDMERGAARAVGCINGAKADDDTAVKAKMRALKEYFMVDLFLWLMNALFCSSKCTDLMVVRFLSGRVR